MTKDIITIEEHQDIVGSRFQLAQIIMKRTNQLLRGAKPAKGIKSKFRENKKADIPRQTLHRIALEELRQGKLHWTKGEVDLSAKDKLVEDSSIIFGE